MLAKSEKGNVSLVSTEYIQKLKEEFKNAGHKIEPGGYLKHKFTDRSDKSTNEYMWVKVVQVLDDETIHGILSNESVAFPHLQMGMLVEININECFEYLKPENE